MESDSRKRERGDLSLLSDMRLHGLLGERKLSRIRHCCHRKLRRSEFPCADRLGVGGVTPPLGLIAARHSAQANGEAGMTTSPSKVRHGVLCHEHHRSTRRCATVREMKEGPSGSAIRSLIPSHRKLLSSKAMVVNVAEKSGQRFRQARLREASASESSMKCRKRIRRCQNRGVTLPPGSAWAMP